MPQITITLDIEDAANRLWLHEQIMHGTDADGTEFSASFDASGQLIIFRYGGHRYIMHTRQLFGQMTKQIADHIKGLENEN